MKFVTVFIFEVWCSDIQPNIKLSLIGFCGLATKPLRQMLQLSAKTITLRHQRFDLFCSLTIHWLKLLLQNNLSQLSTLGKELNYLKFSFNDYIRCHWYCNKFVCFNLGKLEEPPVDLIRKFPRNTLNMSWL